MHLKLCQPPKTFFKIKFRFSILKSLLKNSNNKRPNFDWKVWLIIYDSYDITHLILFTIFFRIRNEEKRNQSWHREWNGQVRKKKTSSWTTCSNRTDQTCNYGGFTEPAFGSKVKSHSYIHMYHIIRTIWYGPNIPYHMDHIIWVIWYVR